jgi:hypothetical protein
MDFIIDFIKQTGAKMQQLGLFLEQSIFLVFNQLKDRILQQQATKESIFIIQYN